MSLALLAAAATAAMPGQLSAQVTTGQPTAKQPEPAQVAPQQPATAQPAPSQPAPQPVAVQPVGQPIAQPVAQPVAQPATTQPVVAETREEAAARDVRQQEAILSNPASTAAQREEAARRLVSRSSPEADDVLLRVLKDFPNRDGRLAVARALASDPTPDLIFVEPLSELFGAAALTEAAAQALVAYKDNEKVRVRLANFASNPTNSVEARTGVIAAMGKLVDQKTAAILIGLLNDNNDRIRDTAADALAEMTGLPRSGDVQGWQQWWAINEAKPELQFSRDLLNQMAARRAELAKRLQQMREDADRRLRESYRAATTDADKTKLLAQYLQHSSEDMRQLGVELVGAEAAQFRAVPAPVFEQLRKMVGDSAAAVRLAVAATLGKAGDAGSVEPLLTQLAQETDPKVRAGIVWALGPSHDMRAIDPLLNALNDANNEVARNAADALGNLAGDLRKPQNQARAAQVAGELNRRLVETPVNFANKWLRTDLVGALAAIAHPSSREQLERLAGPAEQVERVRILALRGLGAIGNKASAFFITPALDDANPLVQVEACRALKYCSDGFGGSANMLRSRISKDYPHPDVRSAAWETMSALFDQADDRELRQWKEYLKNDPDLSRRLRVLEELDERYAAAKEEDKLAANRQDIGAQYLLLNQPEKAVEKTRQALEYYDAKNEQEFIINPIVLQLMEARLRTKKYAEAVDYAVDRVKKDPKVLTDFWKKTRDQIELLKKAGDFNGALELITQFKRLELPDVVLGPLVRLEAEIKQLQSTGGRVWVRSPKSFEHVARFPFHML